MFRQIVIAATIVTLTVGAAGAHGHGRHQRRAEAARRVARALDLTENQKTQLRALRQREREATKEFRMSMAPKLREMRRLRRDGDPRADELKDEIGAMRAELRSIREPFRKQFRSLLTGEQRQKLDARKAEREGRR